MDASTIQRLLYSRRIFLNDVSSRILNLGLYPSRILPFCWWTFLTREFLRYFFPKSNTHGIEHVPIVLLTILWLLSEGSGLVRVVRDIYLWHCGYGSWAKAVFTATWFGLPFVAAIPASVLSFSLGLWLHGLGSPTLLSIFARFLLLFLISALTPFLLPVASAAVLMLLVTDPGRAILNATPYGIIVLQLFDFANFDESIFCNTTVIPHHLRQSRRCFHADALKGAHPRPAGMKNYTYTPLPDDKDSIRLVQVCKGQSPDKPTFSLVTKRLSEKPKYNAISYVWGAGPGRPYEYGLVVDGGWLATTKSTFQILHEHARWWKDDDDDSLFWIDFLCINQQDDVERNRQVQIMGKIYSLALRVIAFLQPDDADESDVAVHFLSSLELDIALKRKRHYGFFPKFLVIPFFFSFIDGFFSSLTGRPPSAGWNALSMLLGHKYWKRMWIVQELALSNKLRIFYGEHRLDWEALNVFANLGPDHMQYIDKSYGTFVHGETINESRYRMRGNIRLMCRRRAGKHLTVQELFTSITAMEVSDDRDRIWAVLGLIPEHVRNAWPDAMEPRYDRTDVKELFEATARFFLETIDSEWLLCMAGIGYSATPNPRLLGLPSWAPDWSAPHPTPLPAMRLRLDPDDNPRICSVDLPDVRVSSSRITEIEHVTPISHLFTPVNMERAKTHFVDQLWNVKHLLRDLRDHAKYPTKGAEIDALGDTFTAGQSQDTMEGFRLYFQFWERLRPITDAIADGPAAPPVLDQVILARALVISSGMMRYSSQMNAWATSTDVCDLRCLAFDTKGRMALVPQHTKKGDFIHAFRGAKSLFVLRAEEAGRPYKLVGDCYMQGVNPSEEECPVVVCIR